MVYIYRYNFTKSVELIFFLVFIALHLFIFHSIFFLCFDVNLRMCYTHAAVAGQICDNVFGKENKTTFMFFKCEHSNTYFIQAGGYIIILLRQKCECFFMRVIIYMTVICMTFTFHLKGGNQVGLESVVVEYYFLFQNYLGLLSKN